MQEIIPMIEDLWSDLCHKNNIELKVINIDSETFTSNLPHLISADAFIITCFNTKIAKAIKVIRVKLQIDTKFIFYLHGLATIALWPLHRFEVLNLLTTDDVFIGTCRGDLHSMKLTMENATTVKIPFTLLNSSGPLNKEQTTKPFVFIGRLSSQKNLDQLILAYSKLSVDLRAKHPLIIFGSEDNLGYPNLGIEEKEYLNKLIALKENLHLENSVIFRGFVDRLTIQEELGSHYIFVSPSTHSDENFGMAAFRALTSGANCVLSAWGGHTEFPAYFQSQIEFVKPIINSERTGVDVNELKNKLEAALVLKDGMPQSLPKNINPESIQNTLMSILNYPSHKQPLRPTKLAETIFHHQQINEKEGKIQKCFDSFEDPLLIKFFEAYSVI